MRRVRVAAGLAPYDVLIGEGALSAPPLARVLGRDASGIVVSSRVVMDLHGEALNKALRSCGFRNRRTLLLPDGEGAKTARGWEQTTRAMAKAGLDRSSFVIAFGGGSIGDVAGFAAATYMRGVPYVQVPTTLLSMVDSSVGGKTGINLHEGKNLVGSFHQPALVLAEVSFLKTLPAREKQSGVYEILKCGLLRDVRLLVLLERTRGLRRASLGEVEAAIAAAVKVKTRIVEGDERERGERVLLNLGHTLGHALEAATAYRVFTHGEGVGYGMEFAVDLSEALGLASAAAARRMRQAILMVGPRLVLTRKTVPRVLRATLSDKKRRGETLKEVLLARAGRPVLRDMNALGFANLLGRWLAVKASEGPGVRPPSTGPSPPSGHAGGYRPAGRPPTGDRPSPRR
jgi:3-dehydroquinate synthase